MFRAQLRVNEDEVAYETVFKNEFGANHDYYEVDAHPGSILLN